MSSIEASQGLVIEHVAGSSPAAFLVKHGPDRVSSAIALRSPYEFTVEGPFECALMGELRWYLEHFLEYPFYPETVRAQRVLGALREWGSCAYRALFDPQDPGNQLSTSETLRVRSDDPHVLSWPWEALYDVGTEAFIAHRQQIERQLISLPPSERAEVLPAECINILMVVARPLERDLSYRFIARPLVDLIHTRKLPARMDILRPPTFDQLREHLRLHPEHYHILHFDGHGTLGAGHFGSLGDSASEGCLVFENSWGEADPRAASEISQLLRECPVPVVVLNACRSADLAQSVDPFATVATSLLRGGVRSVVAMAYSLYASGAQAFLPAFFGCLLESGTVSEAVRAGRQQMLTGKSRPSPRGQYEFEDWLLPVLYQQEPFNLRFVARGTIESRDSRLPVELRKHQEECTFIGRDESIIAMEKAVQRKPPCIVLQGLAGIGKTTLALGFLRWLDETDGLDRALWFDFRDIRTAQSVINRMGEAFYGDSFGLAANKLDLLASAFRDNRAVVVWDNCESATINLRDEDRIVLGRFLESIRGGRGKVIVTSRSSEDWLLPPQRFEINLRGLEGEERWEFCESVLCEMGLSVNRNDPDLSRLIDQLRGHPLATRAVLSRLPQMNAAQISEALSKNIADLGLSEDEERGRLFATLRFVIQELPAELQPIMSLVGLHEAYMHCDFLASMATQVDASWTREKIDRLMVLLRSAGLVRPAVLPVYEMHPLLTGYLRTQATPGSYRRSFVEVMTVLADVLAPKPLHTHRISFPFLAPSFYYALHLSEELGMDEEGCGLAQGLAAYAQKSGNLTEATILFLKLAQRAVRFDRDWEATAYHHLAIVAEEQRNFEAAKDWVIKSLAIIRQQGAQERMAILYHQLGIIAHEQREYHTALEWYSKSRAIREKEGDLKGLASTYHQLGRVAQEQGDHNTAREYYLKSLHIKEKIEDEEGTALTYDQLGSIAEEQGDFTSAWQWHLKALKIWENRGDFVNQVTTCHQIGILASQQQDFDTARAWFLKSLAISEQNGNWHAAGASYHQLGRIAERQAHLQVDLETARTWYLKSLETSEKHRDLHLAAITCGQLGNVAAKQERLEESGKWLTRSIAGLRDERDYRRVERNTRNFLIVYNEASADVKGQLEILWRDAGLGEFPGDSLLKSTHYEEL